MLRPVRLFARTLNKCQFLIKATFTGSFIYVHTEKVLSSFVKTFFMHFFKFSIKIELWSRSPSACVQIFVCILYLSGCNLPRVLVAWAITDVGSPSPTDVEAETQNSYI